MQHFCLVPMVTVFAGDTVEVDNLIVVVDLCVVVAVVDACP